MEIVVTILMKKNQKGTAKIEYSEDWTLSWISLGNKDTVKSLTGRHPVSEMV